MTEQLNHDLTYPTFGCRLCGIHSICVGYNFMIGDLKWYL